MFDLAGRLAPVTGRRRGMGRGTAVRGDGKAIFAASVLLLASPYVHGAPVTGGRTGR